MIQVCKRSPAVVYKRAAILSLFTFATATRWWWWPLMGGVGCYIWYS